MVTLNQQRRDIVMNRQLYKKLALQIRHDYAAVGILPGERILAERYACTRSTIRAALSELSNDGLIETVPNRGHQLKKEENTPKIQRVWNIVMFTARHSLDDPQFLDFTAAVIHQARICRINLIIREIEENTEANTVSALEQLHPGIEADAYLFAACVTERFLGFLENQFKPCVVLGEASFTSPEKRRFFQVCLPEGEKYRFIFKKLLDLGHRKFLLVSPENRKIVDFAEQCFAENRIADALIEPVIIKIPEDASIPSHSEGKKVTEAVKDHTALIVPFGGATSLSIYKQLIERGIKIPEQLSLVIDSGRYEYFVRTFNINSLFSSAWEEGVSCIDELERQLRTGELRFGCKMSNYQYIEGTTVAAPEKGVKNV